LKGYFNGFAAAAAAANPPQQQSQQSLLQCNNASMAQWSVCDNAAILSKNWAHLAQTE